MTWFFRQYLTTSLLEQAESNRNISIVLDNYMPIYVSKLTFANIVNSSVAL